MVDMLTNYSTIIIIILKLNKFKTIKDKPMQFRYDIQGIDCPHCAMELEKIIGKHEQITMCNINFPLNLIVVQSSIDDEDELLNLLQELCNGFEDNIKVDYRD